MSFRHLSNPEMHSTYFCNIAVSLFFRTKDKPTKKKMEVVKEPVANPLQNEDVTALAGKLKHVALNAPLRFSVQALRPGSKSTARFGSLSHHSFFSRHNPHPHRVTHIQGKVLELKRILKEKRSGMIWENRGILTWL